MIDHIDTDNSEFQDAFNLIQFTNSSVFLTGKAGTGKSTFLKYICKHTHKKHVVIAPTGISAINAGGMTIHSFFKAPFRPMMPDDPDLSLKNGRIYDVLKYRKQHVKIIEQTELIIIDEISMVRADLLDFIDRVLRVYTKNMNQPFGGKQILMVGDVFQLEPVARREDWDILRRFYRSPYFFSARVFTQIPLVQIELQKVYRQTDSHFVNLLDKIRVRQALPTDLAAINARFNPSFQAPSHDFFITLATRRDTVDYINDKKLDELKTTPHTFEGKILGEFSESSLPTLKNLVLKENAQVMFIKNDQEKRWYNGSLGIVDEITEDGIFIRMENDLVHHVEKEVWRNIRYIFDEKNNCINEEELGSFTQFPLRLAWAITIHKSQGLTFDKVMIDFTGGAFAGGQVYVALSRCRTLEGMVLKTPVTQRDIIVSDDVMQFSKQSNNKQLIQKQLDNAKADKLYRDASQAFDNYQFREAIEAFAQALSMRNELENPHVRRLITIKTSRIQQLRDEIGDLKKTIKQNQKNVQDFAREYYLLANECSGKYKDNRSALANLDKALKLNPEFLDALSRRADLKVEMGDYESAEKDYTILIKKGKKNHKYYYNRGRTRLLLLNYTGAYNDLLACVRIKDDDAEGYYFLSVACHKMGDDSKSEEYKNIAEQLGFDID